MKFVAVKPELLVNFFFEFFSLLINRCLTMYHVDLRELIVFIFQIFYILF